VTVRRNAPRRRLLFDIGLGSGRADIDELFSPERVPLEEVLGAHGLDLADVTAVANRHLHLDPGGQNHRFAGRPIFVQRREWAMVHEPDDTIPEWVDAPGLRYEVLEGEHEVAPGIRLLPTLAARMGRRGGRAAVGRAARGRRAARGLRRLGAPPPRADPVRVHVVHDHAFGSGSRRALTRARSARRSSG